MDRFAAGRQPAGRAPAPGRLGLVQAYVNSFWDLDAGGADRWATAAGYRAWLRGQGFGGAGAREVSEADRAEAERLREALREMARRNHDLEPAPANVAELAVLDELGARAAVHLRFDPAPRHDAAGTGHDAAVALVLGVVAEAMADGTWSRMKACPGEHCGWLFHDASRNRSSQWCSMRICGNRAKGASFRRRRRGAPHTEN